MIKVAVKGTSIYGSTDAPLTSGTIGRKVVFTFDESWAGLVKIAVFSCGDVTKDTQLDNNNECDFPWEVLVQDNVGKPIYIGICGLYENAIVYPTIYSGIGNLLQGTKISEDLSVEPTPSPTQQAIVAAHNAIDIANSVREDADNGVFNGKSAYQSAVENGYEGTEEEFGAGLADSANGGSEDSNKNGLTDEQAAALEANTEARHKHDNKEMLDELEPITADDVTNLVQSDTQPPANSFVGGLGLKRFLDAIKQLFRKHGENIPASEVSYTHSNIQDKSGTVEGALNESISYVTGNLPDVVDKKHTHGNNTITVPADEVSYTHNNIQDTSKTLKGALDEAIDYVTGTVSNSIHSHSNKDVLDLFSVAIGDVYGIEYNGIQLVNIYHLLNYVTKKEFQDAINGISGSGSPEVKVMSFPQMDGSDIYPGYNNTEIIGFIYDTEDTSKNPLPENAIVVDVGIVLNDDTEIRKNQMCTDDYFGDSFVEIFNTPVYNPNYAYPVFRATDHGGVTFSQPIMDIVQSDGYKHINVYYI